MLTIGAVAKAAGVGVQTLRYYERRGLLSKATRTPAGYRQYHGEEIQRVLFIRRAQSLGFTLDEIRALLALRVRDSRPCNRVKRAAEHARERVSERLADLRRIQSALTALIRACNARRQTGSCPILTALNTGDTNDAAR